MIHIAFHAGKRWLVERAELQLTLLAGVVGIAAGGAAVVFRGLISLFHNLFFSGTFSWSYDATQHTAASPWGAGIILIPVAGAVLVVFLVKNFAPEAKGHGVPEVMDAVYYKKSIIRPSVALIKSLASALSIGSGGSIGREGPIIQIGAALGSATGQLLRLPYWQRYTLISAGAASGIAATFNTPIGGLLFAIELILPEISARTLIPVSIATGAGTFFGRLFFGDTPAFIIPSLVLPVAHKTSLAEFTAYAFLGVLLGLVATLYIRSIYRFEDFFDSLPGTYYTRHMSGMLCVGLMMYLCLRFSGHYYIEGVGYATVQDMLSATLQQPYFLLFLLFAKLLATSLTLGSGASGGVFSPSLFMGAALGTGYGLLLNDWFPALNLNVQGLAVVGMAGLVGGATGAVMTAVVMIFEMTRDYNVIIPLMICVSIAYGVRRILLSESIYTMKLSRRGHRIPQVLQTSWCISARASDVAMSPLLIANPHEDWTALRKWQQPADGQPYIVVLEGQKIVKVLDPQPPGQGEPNEERETTFMLATADDLLLDLLAELEETGSDVAVVVRPDGELDSPGNILGILAFSTIIKEFNGANSSFDTL
ncbi:chloride channel protein [Geopsychrobacter electrodiphilus]|uniref:chloride channel protein n=1 Tax=Geopsychrobacter electrodiphilus TaxID=225196 RepID=UPI00037BF40C|nr:chloride channel protein [Geopsychrobacter electrodiphilus]